MGRLQQLSSLERPNGSRVEKLDRLIDERSLPSAVDELLGHASGNASGPSVNFGAVVVETVVPDAIADLLELADVGVGGRLPSVANSLSLAPVLVPFEPFLKFLRADRVH